MRQIPEDQEVFFYHVFSSHSNSTPAFHFTILLKLLQNQLSEHVIQQ